MAYDKKLHFAAGLLIAISVGFFITPLYGIAAAIFAGFMKEARDWCCYRGFDWKEHGCDLVRRIRWTHYCDDAANLEGGIKCYKKSGQTS